MEFYQAKVEAISPHSADVSSTTESDSSQQDSRNKFGGKTPKQVERRNARERRRVNQVNDGFVHLRDRLPHAASGVVVAKNKKLSKVETLRCAARYIRQLKALLSGEGDDPSFDAEYISCNDSQINSDCLTPFSAWSPQCPETTLPSLIPYNAPTEQIAPAFSTPICSQDYNNYLQQVSLPKSGGSYPSSADASSLSAQSFQQSPLCQNTIEGMCSEYLTYGSHYQQNIPVFAPVQSSNPTPLNMLNHDPRFTSSQSMQECVSPFMGRGQNSAQFLESNLESYLDGYGYY